MCFAFTTFFDFLVLQFINFTVHNEVYVKIVYVFSLTLLVYYLLDKLLLKGKMIPNKETNLKIYFILIFLVILSVVFNRFAFIPTILITSYIFLYNQIASQYSFEKNSASIQTQAVIEQFLRRIEENKNGLININAGLDRICTFKIIFKPKIGDIHGLIKQTISPQRGFYNASPQLTTIFECHDKFNNIFFKSVSFSEINFLLSCSDIRFQNCCFNNVSFHSAILFQACFNNCSFLGVNFSNAELVNTDFYKCEFMQCCFKSSNIIGAHFESSKFDNYCDFHSVIFNKKIGLFYNGKPTRFTGSNLSFNEMQAFCFEDVSDIENRFNYVLIKTKTDEQIYNKIKSLECKIVNNIHAYKFIEKFYNRLWSKKYSLGMQYNYYAFNHDEIKKSYKDWYV